MTVARTSSLPEVAFAVGESLKRHGIEAVLTGGGCASLYTRGAYASVDLDFILTAPVRRAVLDAAMAEAGFRPHRDRYVHPRSKFYVEFPRGPLAIGGDWSVRPRSHVRRGARLLSLTPTDCCRDRLAAYYHWGDRQSLRVAVWVGVRHPVRLAAIRTWSARQGKLAEFEEFRRLLSAARRTKRTRKES